jgi:hypothetical protein
MPETASATTPTRIRKVSSFHELVSTPLESGLNALCWERTLEGDFAEVIQKLGTGEGITTIEDDQLRQLPLSSAGKTAVEIMLEDLRLLRSLDLDPVLDCIHGYLRDETSDPVATDVFSYHADSATIPADTYLCTYHGPSSEGLPNEDVQRRVDIPETRAQLLALFGGEDTEEFREYLNENCFDLHYAPLPHARPYSFGVGNLWRIAVEYPGSPVPPCIHRAPLTEPGDPPRLLLIS